jgi:DnaJ-class molecular chaperone
MVTNKLPAPVPVADINCPTCGGEGVCEHSRPQFGKEPGEWVTWEETCERCDGAGVVLAAACGDCGRVVAMGDLENGFCWRCM